MAVTATTGWSAAPAAVAARGAPWRCDPHQATPGHQRAGSRRGRHHREGGSAAGGQRRRGGRGQVAETKLEGDRQRQQKSNRQGEVEEELRARRWVPAAAAGVAGVSRGSPASAQGGRVVGSRERIWVRRSRSCWVGPTDRLIGSVGFDPTRSPDQWAHMPHLKP